ncbi:MAG: bifunctional (p)ppGpp synthetase/guanosine-3',5'-bis(diphosphate) 3'-pyrophosphohydrolase [Candidatus Sungiibacteriota bacterium]|uniref:Bifunctional (P)ppGpp synthetase/guanosine-3',5'-bis(Diphosphate) 3'-pyrophosphohydrolase n=1 Tax=Candidatus Sungiibacteriota bacterium TaxID=2750080 RepID=A0A7T5RJD1_9BACT|nr:MAG: bifunctional (p)ppGpp synthetase/guanosine-3',5'-bis(diphosphate) 3'-pyrophosphohydrolase [Candidatus Sungbacteria bacterium]
MNRHEFFQKLNGVVKQQDDGTKISWAYWLAKSTHRTQLRINGERYFEHCRRVALNLVHYGPTDADEIITALLHDCLEDGFLPQDFIKALFGDFIAKGVEVLSKYRPRFNGAGIITEKIRISDDDYYRDISCAPSWIRRIKLADRLDNIRDLGVRTPERRQQYIQETKTYLMPLARITDERFLKALEERCEIHAGKV